MSADITESLQNRNNKSAPGPDDIRYSHLKMLHVKHPTIIPQLATACIHHQIFPAVFKLARLVLLVKPDKDPSLTTAYRPLSILSTLGKIIEDCIASLINSNLIISPNTLHDNQYGFRSERSTEQALQRVCHQMTNNRNSLLYTIAISFDIEAAFDSISYQAIVLGCQKLNLPPYLTNIIHNYLHSRTVTYNSQHCSPVKGCPQGSILGPLLWNVGYNPILRILSTLAHVTCYADDTLVILSAPTIQTLQANFNNLCTLYTSLLSVLQIKLNVSKTDILFAPGPLPYHTLPTFSYQNHNIQSQCTIKYLGIYLDSNLTFTPHFQYLYRKSQKLLNSLRPLFANKHGYGNKARKTMLEGTIGSIWKYGSTIFSDKLFISKNIKLVQRTHRQMLLSLTRSYRTVSYLPLTIISNWPPIHYQIHLRSIIFSHTQSIPFSPTPYPIPPPILTNTRELKQFFNLYILELWQTDWNRCKTGQWTKSLIPEAGSHSYPTTFWTTQMLTGHGAFGLYLHKHKRRSSPQCLHCNTPIDSPSHALYECPLRSSSRPTLQLLPPQYPTFRKYTTLIMKARFAHERKIQLQKRRKRTQSQGTSAHQ
jgi:retron-type reverse transcriptase